MVEELSIKAFVSQIPHSKPWITEEDKKAMQNLLANGMIAQGELVKRFEERVAEYNNCIGAFSFSSATSAIVFVLKSLEVGEGDEVIIPTYVCGSVLKAVRFAGAKPVLCDIGEDTWNMTSETIEPCITENTAAIIVVHIFGVPADVQSMKGFGVPIIEDCAHAFGSECNGSKVGSIGDIGVYSFHATKCLTTGEGGMVVTKSSSMFERLMRSKEKMSSYIFPLSDLQAALGLSQLQRYNRFLEKRQKIAEFYFKSFPERWTKRLKGFKKGNIFFRFPLYGDFDFDYIRKEMDKCGIQVRKGVDVLLHSILNLEDGQFSNSVNCLKNTMSIPIYPSLKESESIRVCDTLKKLKKG